MKIGIDISQVVYKTGVSQYTANLVNNLLLLDKENEYILFGGSLRQIKALKEFTGMLSGNFQSKIFPFPPTLAHLIWNRLHVLPIENLIGRVDVFHSSDWTQPPTEAFKVTTIHDLVPFVCPRTANKEVVKTHLSRLYRVKNEVDRIIAVSEATKKDIIEYLKISEEKIKVIYEAAGSEFKPRTEEEIEMTKKKYQLYGNYFLMVGGGPRKNIKNTVKAFEHAKAGKDFKLVMATSGKTIEGRGITQIKSFDDDDLSCLYAGAEALLYPSLYEGFGLSIVQAFTCGCPVVTSNISSMAEIAEKAAVLVDPYNIDSIAEGITKVIKEKMELKEKGFRRAKDFSWTKAAEETLKIYNEAKF